MTGEVEALEYLKQLVEIELAELRSFAGSLPAKPITQIEAASRRIREPVLAQFFRDASTRSHWNRHLSVIEDHVGVGEFVRAHQAIRTAQGERDLARQILQKPYLEKIIGGIASGTKGGRPPASTRDVALAESYLERLAVSPKSLKTTELKRQVGKAKGLNPKTAIAAIDRGVKQISSRKRF